MTILIIIVVMYMVTGVLFLPSFGRRHLQYLKDNPNVFAVNDYNRNLTESAAIKLAGERAVVSALVWPIGVAKHYAVAPMVADYTARQATKEADRVAEESKAIIRAHRTREQQQFDALMTPAPATLEKLEPGYGIEQARMPMNEWRAANAALQAISDKATPDKEPPEGWHPGYNIDPAKYNAMQKNKYGQLYGSLAAAREAANRHDVVIPVGVGQYRIYPNSAAMARSRGGYIYSDEGYF